MYVHTPYQIVDTTLDGCSPLHMYGSNQIHILNKNTLGVKKVRGQSEAALQTDATKNFDIS